MMLIVIMIIILIDINNAHRETKHLRVNFYLQVPV